MKKANLSNRILEMNFMKKATDKAILPKEEIAMDEKWFIDIERKINNLTDKSSFSRPAKLSKYILANSRIKNKRNKFKSEKTKGNIRNSNI